MGQKIKKHIIQKYGSINKFVDENYTKLPMSRTHIYKLLNYEIQNPGIQTLKELANLIGLPEEEVYNDYIAGHRNGQPENQHAD